MLGWTDPYLETCCRSALHRLMLAGPAGRPPGMKDGACLARLTGMDFAAVRPDGRYVATATGQQRHESEVLGSKDLPSGISRTRP
jgi:hypothetical protein